MSASSRGVFRLATLFTLLSVLGGALVCATESGAACPTWPGCFPGQLIPGLVLPPWIEFAHRLVSAACLVLLVMAGISVWSRKDDPVVRWAPWVALAGAVAAATLGMSIIFWGIPKWLGMLDLLCSLLALIAITVGMVAVGTDAPRRWTRPAKAGASAVVLLLVVLALGILVAGPNSLTRCLSWPLLGLLSYDGDSWLQIVRIVLVALAALAVSWLAMTRGGLWWLALGLIAAEVALGAVLLSVGVGPLLGAIYSLTAGVLLWTLVLATAKEWAPAAKAALSR